MSLYLGTRDRLLYVSYNDIAPARFNGPHVTVSPRTAEGRPTRGVAFTLMKPETSGVDPAAGNFTLDIWRASTVGEWCHYLQKTGIVYDDQYITYDIQGGAALFFRVTNCAAAPGIIALAELG